VDSIIYVPLMKSFFLTQAFNEKLVTAKRDGRK
jgi:hypothetical protein